MKSIIIALSLAACALAKPSVDPVDAVVNHFNYDVKPDGNFAYNYETSNGISAVASGTVEQVGKDEVALKISGSHKYLSPEGEPIELSYVADENGYHPVGSHLPTPPPTQEIPVYIQKSLEWIAAHPPKP